MTAIPELPKNLLTMIRQGENYQIEYKECGYRYHRYI